MRVNIYAEELTNRIEVLSKEIDGKTFTGLRIYLYLPVTRVHPNLSLQEVAKTACAGDVIRPDEKGGYVVQARGPFMHHPGDDDSSAVTFWGNHDLRDVLYEAINALDQHYHSLPPATELSPMSQES